jgi:recombination protein RecA
MAKKKADIANEIEEVVDNDKKKEAEIRFNKMISTGSTQLDLAISGKRVRGGGLPGGVIVEISGPSSVGKTAILSEIIASAQLKGGDAKLIDPEARFDQEYSTIYGMEFDQCEYSRPDTVSQMFSELWEWKPKNKVEDAISVFAADSLAALSTETEMEDTDKYGMRRAKEFSEGLRKTARIIANNNWLVPCTNQERESPNGIVTPGGKGIPYYASLRLRLSKPMKGNKIIRTSTINGVKHEKVDGIRTVVKVIKNSIDEPFRECRFSLVFSVGIDNVRDNIEYIKENTKAEKYILFDQEFGRIEKAIEYIESNNLELELENQVIDLWEEIQKAFIIDRKTKVRK